MDLVSQNRLFNYSSVIAGFSNNEMTSYQNEVDTLNAEITLLQNTAGYDLVTSPAVASLVTRRDKLLLLISNIEEVITEITAISNLPDSVKDQLYYFYTVVSPSYVDFMIRMPFNYTMALSDPVIIQLLTDITNTSDAKTATAKLVYDKYKVNANHRSSLLKFYRYL